MKKILPTAKLIYLTMNSDPEVVAEAFTRGASGYLLKTCTAAEIVLAVQQVWRGNTYLSKALSRDTINSIRWKRKDLVKKDKRLTARQREVLQLLAEGKGMNRRYLEHEHQDGCLSQVPDDGSAGRQE